MSGLADDREARGPRDSGRTVHYELCNGVDCPCYLEEPLTGGKFVEWLAASPLSTGTVRVLGAGVVGLAGLLVGWLFLRLGGGGAVLSLFVSSIVYGFWHDTRED